jgi:hypothetical protein
LKDFSKIVVPENSINTFHAEYKGYWDYEVIRDTLKKYPPADLPLLDILLDARSEVGSDTVLVIRCWNFIVLLPRQHFLELIGCPFSIWLGAGGVPAV